MHERVGLGYGTRREMPVELAGVVVDAGGEQPVGQRLREHIGEGVFAEVGNQRLPRRAVEVGNVGGQLVLAEALGHHVAGQVGEPGHAPRQLLGGGDGRRVAVEEVAQQRGGFGDGAVAQRQPNSLSPWERVGVRASPAAVKLRQAGDGAALAVHVPAEFGVVGEQQVGQRFPVALELPPVDRGRAGAVAVALDFVEAHADVLGLDVADGHAVLRPADGVVGRAALDALRFVGGGDAVRGRLQQRLERGPVGVLGGVAVRQAGLQRPDVIPECASVGHAKHLAAACGVGAGGSLPYGPTGKPAA